MHGEVYAVLFCSCLRAEQLILDMWFPSGSLSHCSRHVKVSRSHDCQYLRPRFRGCCMDTSGRRHFGSKTTSIMPNTSAVRPKCLRDSSTTLPNCATVAVQQPVRCRRNQPGAPACRHVRLVSRPVHSVAMQ